MHTPAFAVTGAMMITATCRPISMNSRIMHGRNTRLGVNLQSTSMPFRSACHARFAQYVFAHNALGQTRSHTQLGHDKGDSKGRPTLKTNAHEPEHECDAQVR
jgi:hypothetical protein